MLKQQIKNTLPNKQIMLNFSKDIIEANQLCSVHIFQASNLLKRVQHFPDSWMNENAQNITSLPQQTVKLMFTHFRLNT